MVTAASTHPGPVARARRGADRRRSLPPEAHAELDGSGARDPVGVLARQVPSRVPSLVPLRHERMAASPFAFFRGSAAVMAADLARMPSTGLTAQLCGDAHLANFGMFASRERRLVFDVNDFDETHPGPWEWDVKRLAASLVLAGRENGFADKQIKEVVRASVRTYQEAMTRFARQGNLAVWFARVDVEEIRRGLRRRGGKKLTRQVQVSVDRALRRDHMRSLGKLTELVDGHRRFVADPPLLVPLTDLVPSGTEEESLAVVRDLVQEYAGSLAPGQRELVRSYTFVDLARKVVGVGSVGTRCWVALLLGRDDADPLLLQVKQALPSALERHPAAGSARDEGLRVVTGQRIMQATPDLFLGAQQVVGPDGHRHDFYVRQLQDWKGSMEVELMRPKGMRLYGRLCAWTLARAHARSGDRIAIAAYLGTDGAFARAVTAFATSYADLAERDHVAFARAVDADPLLGDPHAG